jgi:dinuclear metal center YbgI/SA1388 family protein
MDLNDFKAFVNKAFGDLLLQFKVNDEYGFNNPVSKNITRVGYATNLSIEVAKRAAEKELHLLITHHDAWDFLFGLKEQCLKLLEEQGIAHFYMHLPLDFAEFGTCNSLLREIGASQIVQQTQYIDGKEIIGIGEFREAVTFEELVDLIEGRLGEKVGAWRNSDALIKRVGVITGAGNSTELLRQAKEAECDVYITGEKTLYSLQYAKFIGLNLIVGSHTFTEIFGVKSLAAKLKEEFEDIEVIYLEEEHLESCQRISIAKRC